jgi:hypothetical protein
MITKARFTRLLRTIDTHVERRGPSAALMVHRENMTEIYEECMRHHTTYVNKMAFEGDENEKATKWAQDLDTAYRRKLAEMTRLINENDQTGGGDEEPIVNPRSPRTLEATLRAKKRKLEDDLEDSRIEEARRVEDIRRRSQREQQAIETKLAIARKRTDESGQPEDR